MLQLSTYFASKPILSLRTGTPVAQIGPAIINPKNLKIEGFYCRDTLNNQQLILLTQDIRDLSRQGFIINDHDVLATEDDLIRLQDILNIGFELLKKPVETTEKVRVGKVEDYAVDASTMYIQKLYVAQPVWRSLTNGTLSIDRTQIVEVTSKYIIINELLRPTPSTITAIA
jgi:sporulation protein YlmC with PRC-barrel domain